MKTTFLTTLWVRRKLRWCLPNFRILGPRGAKNLVSLAFPLQTHPRQASSASASLAFIVFFRIRGGLVHAKVIEIHAPIHSSFLRVNNFTHHFFEWFIILIVFWKKWVGEILDFFTFLFKFCEEVIHFHGYLEYEDTEVKRSDISYNLEFK